MSETSLREPSESVPASETALEAILRACDRLELIVPASLHGGAAGRYLRTIRDAAAELDAGNARTHELLLDCLSMADEQGRGE